MKKSLLIIFETFKSHVSAIISLVVFLGMLFMGFPVFSQTNLIENGGFEDGTTGYSAWTATIATSSDAKSGSLAASVTNRNNPWETIAKDVTSVVELGKEYKLTFWIKLSSPATNLRATLGLTIDGAKKYKGYCWTATPVVGEYIMYTETFTITESGSLTAADLYFETEAVGEVYSDFLIDDISLTHVSVDPDTDPVTIGGLKDIKCSMSIGGCLTDGNINYFTNAKAKAQALKDCNSAQVQCYPAWGRWDETKPYVYYLESTNTKVKELKQKNMKVTTHMLAGWDQYFPNWYKTADFDSTTVDTMLKHWIETIITYKGNDTLVDVWNVVNEAISWDGKGGYWPIYASNNNNACELQRIGFEPDSSGLAAGMKVNASHPVYIRRAFEHARTKTNKKLELRETSMEFPTDQKYKAFYQLAVHLKNVGAPIDVIGFQTHLDLGNIYDWDGYANNIKRFRALGYEVIVPEVDFGDKLKLWTEEKAELQKIAYYQLITAAIKGGASDFQLWGFYDGSNPSWRPGESAFPFTSGVMPKPAYYGIQEALIDMSQILYWDMESAVNDSIPDVMVYNNFGKQYNFGTTTLVTGFKSKALQFDGVDDYVTTDTLSESIEADFTLSLMLKTTAAKQMVLADLNNGSENGLQLLMNSEGLVYVDANAAGLQSDLISQTPVNDGKWHFVAVRRDSTFYRIFIDTFVPEQSKEGTILSFNRLSVGAGFDAANNFEGTIDELRLYDTQIETASYSRNLSPSAPMSMTLGKNKMIMKLNWTDLSINEEGFAVERKVAGGSWIEIGTVLVNIKTYTDTVPEYSTEYTYRVKAYNRYGSSGYTNTKTIVSAADPTVSVFNPKADSDQIIIFPNPAKDSFAFKSSDVVKFKLFNILGELVMAENISPNQTIDISQLNAGLYFVSCYETENYNLVKLVKE